MIQVARGAYFETHQRRIYNNQNYIIKLQQVTIYSKILVNHAFRIKLDIVASREEMRGVGVKRAFVSSFMLLNELSVTILIIPT